MPNAAQFLALCAIYGVTDVMATFTGAGGSLAGLNAEGRRLVSDYIRVLLASRLYAEALYLIARKYTSTSAPSAMRYQPKALKSCLRM